MQTENSISIVASKTSEQLELVKAIEDSKRPIKAVVFDQNEDIFKYIRKGIIAATIDHEPFSQGYNPIVLMYNHLVDGYELSSERELSGATVIDIDNIDDHVVI